ncbi:EF-hand domain-containing protein [bacterium]|nr:EF-hand domain-containing protein [bacterium]
MEINGRNYNFKETKNDISYNDFGVKDKKLKNIFDHFDANKDGKLSAEELDTAFKIFSDMDNTGGFSNKKLSDEEVTAGILALPKSARISVDAMKTFITRLVTINNGKNVAQDIYKQIDGISWYKNTIEKLKSINKDNVIEVWKSYSNVSKNDESLASAIDNEIKLDVEEVKIYICKPLVARAQQAGVACGDYSKFKNIDEVNKFIEFTIQRIENVENKKLVNDFKKETPFDSTDYPQYENVLSYVEKAAKSHKNNLNENQMKDITKMVVLACKKYNISEISPIIAQMLGTESGGFVFDERSMDPDLIYKGVMQVDYETCCCVLNKREPMQIGKTIYGKKSDEVYNAWHDAHFSQDEALIEKIRAKYPNPSDLYEAIKADVELGLEIGILAYKAKLSQAKGNVKEAVALYCGANYSCDFSTVPAKLDIKPKEKK